MRNHIITTCVLLSIISTNVLSQSCNTSGLLSSGNITPPTCNGTFNSTYLVDDATEVTLSATVSNQYSFTASYSEKYIEIYDGSNTFISDLYIYMDYYSYLMDTVQWIPPVSDSYTLKVYEIYTCTPSGYGIDDLLTACQELPCAYNMSANDLGNYTPDSLGNITTVSMTSGDMISFNALQGHAYKFSTCNNFNWNTTLYLYNSGGSSLIKSSKDDCGASMEQSEMYWLASATGTFELHLAEFFCDYSGSANSHDLEISSIGTPEFIVNVTSDSGDANIGDMICDDGTGNCSLRAAIEETNFFDGISPEILFDLNTSDTIEITNGILSATKSGLYINGEISNLVNIRCNDISQIKINGDSTVVQYLTFTKPSRSSGVNECINWNVNEGVFEENKVYDSWRGFVLSGNNNLVRNNDFLENITQGVSFSGSNNLFKENHFYNNQYGAIGTNNSWGVNNILTKNTFKCNNNFAYSNHGNSFTKPTIIQSSSTLNLIEGTADPSAIIEVYLDSLSCSGFPCQGQTLLGTTTADNTGYWYLLDSIQNGDVITATSTYNGATSEFSQCTISLPSDSEYVCSSISVSDIRFDFLGGIDTTGSSVILWSKERGKLDHSLEVSGPQLVILPDSTLVAGEELSISLYGIKDLAGNIFNSKNFLKTVPIPYPALPQFDEFYLGITLPNNALDYSYQLMTADLNSDGLKDFIYRYHSSYGSPTNTLIYLQQSNGSFTLNTYSNSQSHSRLTATPDLNNDGYPDIVLSHNVPSSINVRLNNGDGSFGSSTFYTVTNYSADTECGDIDNDGDIDIISMSGNASNSSNRISLLLNNGDGTFANQININNGIAGQSIHLADLDSDGDLEIAHTSRDTWGGPQKFQVYENDGSGNFSLSVDETISENTIIADIKDLNNDGFQDILFEVPEVRAFYGNDTILDYSYINAVTLNSNNQRMLIGDLDGDQDFDFYNKSLWCNSLYDGTNYINSDTLNVGIRHNQFLTDFDSDGDLDLPFIKSDRTLNLLQNTCGEGQNVIVVNTTDDIDDGICDCNHCSLREAANLASLDTAITTILFEIQSPIPHEIILGSRLDNFAYLKIDLEDSSLNYGDVVIDHAYNVNLGLGQGGSFQELRKLKIKNATFWAGQNSIIDSCLMENSYFHSTGIGSIIRNCSFVNLSPINYFPGDIVSTWHGPVVIENNYFDLSSGIVGVRMAGWSGGSDITVSNNVFKSSGTPSGRGIDLEGSNHIITNNIFKNLALAIRGTPNNDDHSDYNLISQNYYICNNYGVNFISNPTRTVNNDIQPPVITFIKEDSILGTSLPESMIELYSVSDTCNNTPAVQGNNFLGQILSDINGNWAYPTDTLNIDLGHQFAAIQIDSLNNTSEFSNSYIVLPDACKYAEELPVNIEPCNTTGVVLDLKEMTTSPPTPSSSCSTTFQGNDAWYKVEVPTTGNFLIRQNLNNTVDAVVEAYSGDCNNLLLEQCAILDSVPHAITFENYAPGSFIYLRVWDKDNTIVNSPSSALLHLTAHELDLSKSEWELCDEENNYLVNGNPTILSERDANTFIVEYEDNATPAEIQEVRDSLILGGGTLIDSCLCGTNPLELWDHATPIDMEENKRGSLRRARVDTSNYNYKFESIEFQVNAYAIGEQYDARVDMDQEGNFVITWIDKQRRHNYGRLYKSSGNPITQEFQIGASNKTQFECDVLMHSNGNFVAVWQEINSSVPGSSYNIYARQYDNQGNPLAPPFDISTDAVCGGSPCNPPSGIEESAQYGVNPAIGADNQGNFVVVWNVGSSIYGQRYTSSASKTGQVFEIAANSNKSSFPSTSVDMNDSGSYVVAWTGLDNDETGVFVQRYSSNGNTIGSVIQANTYTTGDQSNPDISIANDGSFIVTWQSYDQEGAGQDFGIYAQRFDNTGNPIGPELHVNSYTSDAQRSPSISTLDDGTFFIAWSSFGQDGFQEGIYGQFFDNLGNTIDGEFRLNNLIDPEQDYPATATNGESIVIGTWQDGANDGSFTGIFGQRYEIIDAGGQKVYYPIGTATPSTLLGDELSYPGTIYSPQDSLSNVRVAIIDTGVDPNHPYLADAIWNNQQVGSSCYVNDTLGYDFVNDTPYPIDYDGHGTKVNGIIARDFPADIQLELMNLKFHEFQKGKVFDAVCAIYYAVDNGADIINMSWGFEASEYPSILKKAIQYASDNDVLLITTAGNTSKDNDKLNKFPCNLDIDNLIRVTSFEYKSNTNIKRLANYASFGKNNVDIAAYGFVETPTLGDTLTLSSGTSLAAPHITRTAAIIKGLFPNLTAADIKDCILTTAFPESDFTDKVATGGILDHDAAIDCAYFKAGNCVAIDLFITVPQTQDTIYRSDVHVESDANINSNANVEMWGAEYVKMLPGFETTLGTEYLADIDDCDPANDPGMMQPNQDEAQAFIRLRENSVHTGKIKLQFWFDGEPVEISLKNQNGQLVKSFTFKPNGNERWYEKIIDAKLLKSDIYTIERSVVVNNEIITQQKAFQVYNKEYQKYLTRNRKKSDE